MRVKLLRKPNPGQDISVTDSIKQEKPQACTCELSDFLTARYKMLNMAFVKGSEMSHILSIYLKKTG